MEELADRFNEIAIPMEFTKIDPKYLDLFFEHGWVMVARNTANGGFLIDFIEQPGNDMESILNG